jgi:hypothetical protein
MSKKDQLTLVTRAGSWKRLRYNWMNTQVFSYAQIHFWVVFR